MSDKIDIISEVTYRWKLMVQEGKRKEVQRLQLILTKIFPVDWIFYQFKENENPHDKYYMERYLANRKFQKQIEENFRPEVQEIDARKLLPMWQLAQRREQKKKINPMRLFDNGAKKHIEKKLRYYARPGIEITKENVEYYLELLAGHEKREKKLLEAEEHISAEFLCYMDENGGDLEKQNINYMALKYRISQLSALSLPEEEVRFWEETALQIAFNWSEDISRELKKFIVSGD